jgi:hypothetical protein
MTTSVYKISIMLLFLGTSMKTKKTLSSTFSNNPLTLLNLQKIKNNKSSQSKQFPNLNSKKSKFLKKPKLIQPCASIVARDFLHPKQKVDIFPKNINLYQ